jgi:hypothetical protein
MKDVVWVPISEFAKEYNKHPTTILRWIHNEFIYALGVRVKRDISGYWYIGRLEEKPQQPLHTV